jgi:hypothetical protein
VFSGSFKKKIQRKSFKPCSGFLNHGGCDHEDGEFLVVMRVIKVPSHEPPKATSQFLFIHLFCPLNAS